MKVDERGYPQYTKEEMEEILQKHIEEFEAQDKIDHAAQYEQIAKWRARLDE